MGGYANYLDAWTIKKQHHCGDSCVLRMEDIDQTRCRPEFVQGILKDLEWLGIHRDVCRIAVAFGCIVEYHGILAIVMHEVACIFHILVGVVIKRMY